MRDHETFLDEVQPFIDYTLTVEENKARLLELGVIKSADEVSTHDVECMITANRDAAWEDDNYDPYEHGLRGGLGVRGY